MNLWQIMGLRDDQGRARLAIVAGAEIILLLWPSEMDQAETMCIWRNAALAHAQQQEQAA